MKTVTVNATREYDVIIDNGILDNAGLIVKEKFGIKKICIITDDTDFRSAQTGYSMRDLANAYDSILKNNLANVSQFIIENGISRNSDVLKNTLQNQADAAVLESNLNAEKAATQKELMKTNILSLYITKTLNVKSIILTTFIQTF